MKFSAILIAAVALANTAFATSPPVKPPAPIPCNAACKNMPCLAAWCKEKNYWGTQYFTITVGNANPRPPRTVYVTRTVEVGGGDGDRTVTRTKTCTTTVTRRENSY
ncbi:hypothetical protein Dda_0763 [Drechslerella dactyloides]|uniref:Uncharacterized protein n=1 Tax=Drechslerella dactyloides TaxID=74499 RepID=A0AAD6J553_DREDA|nr:hypothetical protein Dda_0763 [Drechslerella dactyloides]